MADQFVYLMSSPAGGCKVGFSTNPKKRLIELRSAGHLDLTIVKTWQAPHARSLEAHILRLLSPKRIAGEWLSLPAEQVLPVVGNVAERFIAGEIKPSVYLLRKAGLLAPKDIQNIGRKGSIASVASRTAAVDARIRPIEGDWRSGKGRTRDLLEKAGVTYQSVVARFGARPKKDTSRARLTAAERLAVISLTARISGERREARAKAACETIRERWALPSDQHPTLALLAEAGVSRATAKKHLGHRDKAQAAYIKAQAQAERNRARRKSDV